MTDDASPHSSGISPSASAAGPPLGSAPDAIGSGASTTSAAESTRKPALLAILLGCLTLAGLVLMILALNAHANEVPYPLPIELLSLGAFVCLAAGIPWAHTRGWAGLKVAFLGTVGFAGGGAAGTLLGDELGSGGETTLGIAVFLVIGGFWVGAILFGWFGIWRGIAFHRRQDLRNVDAAADRGNC
jgi:hypothetical protein